MWCHSVHRHVVLTITDKMATTLCKNGCWNERILHDKWNLHRCLSTALKPSSIQFPIPQAVRRITFHDSVLIPHWPRIVGDAWRALVAENVLLFSVDKEIKFASNGTLCTLSFPIQFGSYYIYTLTIESFLYKQQATNKHLIIMIR